MNTAYFAYTANFDVLLFAYYIEEKYAHTYAGTLVWCFAPFQKFLNVIIIQNVKPGTGPAWINHIKRIPAGQKCDIYTHTCSW